MSSQAKRAEVEKHPCGAQGASKGDGVGEQGRLDFSSQTGHQIATLYRALQLGTVKFGGIDALAAETGKSAALTRLKVFRREDTKGEVQRAHLDLLGHVVADPEVRWAVLSFLCDEWGAKPPQPKSEPTDAEKLHNLQIVLDASGDVGDDIRVRAARAGGFHPSALRSGR